MSACTATADRPEKSVLHGNIGEDYKRLDERREEPLSTAKAAQSRWGNRPAIPPDPGLYPSKWRSGCIRGGSGCRRLPEFPLSAEATSCKFAASSPLRLWCSRSCSQGDSHQFLPSNFLTFREEPENPKRPRWPAGWRGFVCSAGRYCVWRFVDAQGSFRYNIFCKSMHMRRRGALCA